MRGSQDFIQWKFQGKGNVSIYIVKYTGSTPWKSGVPSIDNNKKRGNYKITKDKIIS